MALRLFSSTYDLISQNSFASSGVKHASNRISGYSDIYPTRSLLMGFSMTGTDQTCIKVGYDDGDSNFTGTTIYNMLVAPNITGSTATITNLNNSVLYGATGLFSNLNSTNLTGSTATITNLISTNGNVSSLTGGTCTLGEIRAKNTSNLSMKYSSATGSTASISDWMGTEGFTILNDYDFGFPLGLNNSSRLNFAYQTYGDSNQNGKRPHGLIQTYKAEDSNFNWSNMNFKINDDNGGGVDLGLIDALSLNTRPSKSVVCHIPFTGATATLSNLSSTTGNITNINNSNLFGSNGSFANLTGTVFTSTTGTITNLRSTLACTVNQRVDNLLSVPSLPCDWASSLVLRPLARAAPVVTSPLRTTHSPVSASVRLASLGTT